MKKKIIEQTEIDEDTVPTADVPEGDELDETAAADSIKTKGVSSRIDMMTNTVSAMAKMGNDELTKWFRDAIETSSHYSAAGLGTADRNKSSLNMKASGTGSNPMGPFPYVPVAKEDLAVVFDGQELKEGMLDKALTLFEAALNVRLVLESTKIQEDFDNKLVEAIEEIRQDLTEKVDQYLDYAAQEFVSENEIAIENALKVELFEDFMGGLKSLFVEHYVEIPEDKIDVLNSLSEQVVELKEKLNEVEKISLEKDDKINEMLAQGAFDDISEGLSVTDTEKFKVLVETVEFDGDLEALKEKLTIIKEANFKGSPKRTAKTGIIQESDSEVLITGDVDGDGNIEVKKPDPRVASYVAAISRTAKASI